MAQISKLDAGVKGQGGRKKPAFREEEVGRKGAAAKLGETTTIPQNRLRNQSGDVLRRAERGERFIVTVNGRPAAELGPLPGVRKPASPAALRELLAKAPPDAAWLNELLEMRAEDEAAGTDPWA